LIASRPTYSPVTASVVAFLKHVPPFHFLPEDELRAVAATAALEYFPRDTQILTAGVRRAGSLFIVQKGGVKLTVQTEDGAEVVFDYRSEGELFGLLSVMGGDVVRMDVTAIEDTICYSIPSERIQQLIATYPEVGNYLYRSSFTRYMDRSLREIRARAKPLGDGERLLYSLSAGDVARRAAITCEASFDVREAAARMDQAHATCLFVTDDGGAVIGIVTDRDFRSFVARGVPPGASVTSIMSSPVITVGRSERAFQVLLRMLARDIHHVLVTDESGRPDGVITHHDLMLLQGKSPLFVARQIERQETVDGLASVQNQVTALIPLLMREGAKANHISRVIAEINDRTVAKIMAIAEQQLGPPPTRYCWLALGSEGRREQTLKTDQDNALVYDDVSDTERPAVEEYFARLAAFAGDALVHCGYPLCSGDYMASNPRWRLPLSEWKRQFETWMADAKLLDLQDAVIFFDMRPVAGDANLCDELTRHYGELLPRSSAFKSVLAFLSSMHKPPLGFFRTFVLQRSGEHRHEFDIKLTGTHPIVHAARIFALDAGIQRTNTVDRLLALQSVEYEDGKLLNDLQEAFEFLLLLRLETHLRQLEAGQQPSNYVNPETLTALQKSLLKEAFHSVTRVQAAVEARFKSALWAQLR
jgi:CBS domain-containing protein